MFVDKVQSILIVTGFVTFVALSGITLGLTAVSAFARPVSSVQSVNLNFTGR